MPENRRDTERRVVGNMLNMLIFNGWKPVKVVDGLGGETDACDGTHEQAMALIFNLDDMWVYFKHPSWEKPQAVYLVGGNGEDIISDWTYRPTQEDNFNNLMREIVFGEGASS